jgi:hypothetical protein
MRCVPGELFSVGEVFEFSLVEERPVARVRQVEHSWFGTMLAPEGVGDFGNIVGDIAVAFGVAGWRGQASLCWRIDSSLSRRVRARDALLGDVVGTGDPLDRVVNETEARLLGRARLAGHDRHDGKTLSDLELLAVLQHHGAATRLLDCTLNAYVALWFACRDRDHAADWGLVAAFDVAEATPILTSEQRDRRIGDVIRGLGHGFGTWRPQALSPRIAAQQGLFVFSRVVDRPWGSMMFRGGMLDKTGDVPGLNIFAISPDLKAAFADLWEPQFGYTKELMFPDIDGFAAVHGPTSPFPSNFFDGENVIP